jgi:hypothetical protein
MSGEAGPGRARGGTFRRPFPSSPWKGRRLARRLNLSAQGPTIDLADGGSTSWPILPIDRARAWLRPASERSGGSNRDR